MKRVKFVQLLFKYGSLSAAPFDFGAYKATIVKGLPYVTHEKVVRSKNGMVGHVLFNVKAEISFLLNAVRQKNSCTVIPFAEGVNYVRIPKCASTTIHKYLLYKSFPDLKEYTLTEDQIDVLSEALLPHTTTQKRNTGNSFAVVRNPLHRLVSAYLSIFKESEHFVYQNYLTGIFKPDDDFDTFVNKLEAIPPVLMDQNIKPQSLFMHPMHTTCIKLESGLDKIKQYDPDFQLPEKALNAGTYHKAWWKYYTKDSLWRAEKIYQKDIALLGYSAEIENLRNQITQ